MLMTKKTLSKELPKMSHQKNNTTEAERNPHLTYEQRIKIEAHFSDGLKAAEIAKKLGKHRTTIGPEIKLGLVVIDHWAYAEKRLEYSATVAQPMHERRNSGKGKGLKIGNNHEFMRELERLLKRGYSPYAALNDMKNRGIAVDICEKTVYNYVNGEVFLEVTNKDLPCHGKQKKREYRKIRCAENNKRGTSISERPQSVETREEIGHWEIDLVVGKKGTKAVILTLFERKSRKCLLFRLKNKTQKEVMAALKRLSRRFGADFVKLFKTITADNGSEFLDFESMEKALRCKVKIYYAHPYSSWERGTNENGNRMLRRFYPKGTDFSSIPYGELRKAQEWINNYPRKILSGKTANMLFENAA